MADYGRARLFGSYSFAPDGGASGASDAPGFLRPLIASLPAGRVRYSQRRSNVPRSAQQDVFGNVALFCWPVLSGDNRRHILRPHWLVVVYPLSRVEIRTFVAAVAASAQSGRPYVLAGPFNRRGSDLRVESLIRQAVQLANRQPDLQFAERRSRRSLGLPELPPEQPAGGASGGGGGASGGAGGFSGAGGSSDARGARPAGMPLGLPRGGGLGLPDGSALGIPAAGAGL